MSNPFMKKWLAAALCALALGSTAALAEGDSFYLGTGRDLAYELPAGSKTINEYARVAVSIDEGDIGIEVDSCTASPCFPEGALVMVLQTTGYMGIPEVKDSPPPFSLSNTNVGRWELARVKKVVGTTLELTAPLIRDYAREATQVIWVREYTDVTIRETSTLTARAWDGKVGGVLAFLATGLVRNDGRILATGAGFRGGRFVNGSSSSTGCKDNDVPALNGGAQKGEGIANLYYGDTHTGRGYVLNGGGGGVCSRSGGGGGGNGGMGGLGGYAADLAPTSTAPRNVGGRGGVALNVGNPPLIDRLLLGGGGGAGHGYLGNGQPGGNGGGIIFIRGNNLDGVGAIRAGGSSGGSSDTDAASGGGAGGSIYLRFAGAASCLPDNIDASGGVGGGVATASRVGPGGGGGGGQVLFQATYEGTCQPQDSESIVIGATPGTQKLNTAPGGPAYGAQGGGDGIAKRLPNPFVVPSVPTVTSPSEGIFIKNPRPDIRGHTTESTADSKVMVAIFIDGVEVGRVTPLENGDYFFPLPSGWPNLVDGLHQVQAANEVDGIRGPKSPAVTFTVDTTPPVTKIVKNPPLLGNSRSATFEFDYTGTEVGTVSYQCKRDTDTDFTPCPNPRTYTGLVDGKHTLLVRAVDDLGNADLTPERYEWTVDTTAPGADILAPLPAKYSNSKSATFQFNYTAMEPGTVKYQCKLDTEPVFTDCTSPKTYTGLVDGERTFLVQAIDEAGNADLAPATHTWIVDTLPPGATISSSPPKYSNSNSATFQFTHTATELGTVRYQCKLETEADFTPCTGPKTYTGLSEGSHTFEVLAIDEAGNVDSKPAKYTWTVDIKQPDTFIDEKPANPTNARSAKFTFHSDDKGTVRYECRLLPATFTPCMAPVDYTALSGDEYTFEVRAIDEAGNVDPSPASYTWTVDTKEPDTVIDDKPANPTHSADATFTFSSDDKGTVKYECRLLPATFTSCAGPVSYTGLSEGPHTFEVRAIDAAGNVDSTPAPYQWTVDLTKPDVNIVSGPSAPTRETSATFGFNSNEAAKDVTYLCRLDDALDFTPCPNPQTYTGLGEGRHTLQVIAMDKAGNMSVMPAERTWTVDTTAPVTKIVSGPASTTRQTSATFDFDVATPEPGVKYECKLDTEADFTECPDPKTYTGLGEGKHTLLVRAVDALGNADLTPERYEWTVDTLGPVAPVVSQSLEGATFDTSTPVLTGTAEPGSTVTVIIDGKEVGTVTADASGNWNYTPTTSLKDGPHEVKARATDPSGNEGPVSDGRTFTVRDTTKPETTITSGPSGSTSESSATFHFSANEPGVTYECSLDGAAYTPCTSPVTFNDLAPGEHTFQVRSRDTAGNVEASPDSRTWTVTDGKGGGDISFLGDGFGCSATGGDSTLVLMGLGSFLALARRRRRN